MKQRFDAVVVGAGAGGAAVAWRLCEHGLKVLLLEAGPRFEPGRDYPLDRPDWEKHYFPVKPGSQGDFTIGTLDRLASHEVGLRSWNRATGRLVHSDRREATGPGYWHVQGVGGSTLHFVGESHRLHPAALQMRKRRRRRSFPFFHRMRANLRVFGGIPYKSTAWSRSVVLFGQKRGLKCGARCLDCDHCS